jgi:hypothetical protein
MRIPILRGHRLDEKPIGFVQLNEAGKLCFKFSDEVRITRSMLFEIFGDAGIIVSSFSLEKDGVVIVHAGTILEFSLPFSLPFTAAQ